MMQSTMGYHAPMPGESKALPRTPSPRIIWTPPSVTETPVEQQQQQQPEPLAAQGGVEEERHAENAENAESDEITTHNKKPLPSMPSLATPVPTRLPLQVNTSQVSLQIHPQSPMSPLSPVSKHSLQGWPSSSTMSLTSVNPDPLLDHSHLKPGQNASLLSYAKTINMYHSNAKKTNDMEIQCDFAIFLVEAAKRLMEDSAQSSPHGQHGSVGPNSPAAAAVASSMDASSSSSSAASTADTDNAAQEAMQTYLAEAAKLLRQLSTRGHGPSQYYLANMFASGLLHKTNKIEFDKAFPLYLQAAKHHHPDAAYRTAKCYEDGLGTRRDKGKAVQFYRKAATLNHPGAMYRLGLAQMKGELGMSINIRDGHKWLKRSAEASTLEYPHALHELAQLHERGLASIIFMDHDYAVRLYHEATDLNYAPSCFRLGECYEFGRLGCNMDPRQSMHFYSMAADQGHARACFALTAWYLVGVPDLLAPDDEQAFAWALRAADQGLPKAEYAVGYFYEVGIGIQKNERRAMEYYTKAAQHGEKRAIHRVQQQATQHYTTSHAPHPPQWHRQSSFHASPPPPPTPLASNTRNTSRHMSQPPPTTSTAPPSSWNNQLNPTCSSASSSSSALHTLSSHSSSSASSPATPRRHSLQPPSPAWIKKWSQKLRPGRSF
ncbi:hypothetical protein BC940DRAFT_313572 [Gongronella butleri]|nr:hypothetical protein BC940DRAFT_313572 [Gongronella butleri]